MRSDFFALKFSFRIFIWLFCLLLIGENWVFAYVIDGPKILQLSARQIGRAETLQVQQNLTTYSFNKGPRSTKTSEIVRYIFPEIFRIDQTTDGIRGFFLAKNDRSIAVIDDRVDSRAESELDLYHHLLLQHRSNGLIALLEAYGIDTAISSLGKFEKKVAYVIGAQYPDETQSQLWIDKESFLPIRWILVSLSNADFSQQDEPFQDDPPQDEPVSRQAFFESLEFRFFFWRKYDRLQYPMRITILQNGVLVREIRMDEVTVNPDIDKALMNIDQQKALFPGEKQPQIEEEPLDSTDDIQRTIDNFKKKFE